MAQNKKYSAHLQKLRMSGASAPNVDPALNSYVLMALRSNPITAIDEKNKPAVRGTPSQHLCTAAVASCNSCHTCLARPVLQEGAHCSSTLPLRP